MQFYKQVVVTDQEEEKKPYTDDHSSRGQVLCNGNSYSIKESVTGHVLKPRLSIELSTG